MSKFGILFDLDGTLVDSLADICANLNDVRALYGLAPMPHDSLARHIGSGVENLTAAGFPELPPSEQPTILEKYRETYLATPFRGGALYPGVEETLGELRRRGAKLGVATNKQTRVAEATLAHYLPGFAFDVVHGADKVSKRKPDGAHLRETMHALGLAAERTWYVGDHAVDRLAAKDAGVTFLAAVYGFGGVKCPPEEHLVSFPQLLKRVR